jgi:hypothetical protein
MIKKISKIFPVLFLMVSLGVLLLTQSKIELIQIVRADCRGIGESWNECCADGLSKSVTCTGVGSDGCCNSWDTGDCDQVDSACDYDDDGGGGDDGGGDSCDGATNTCCDGDRYMSDGSIGPEPWCGTIGSETIDGPCNCDGSTLSCTPCGDGTVCQGGSCVPGTSSCTVDGSCSRFDCNNVCTIGGSPVDCQTTCGIWIGHDACNGETGGCSSADTDHYNAELSNKGSMQYSEDYWCTTQQMDTSSGGGEYAVVYIGDGGAWCANWFDGSSGTVQNECGNGASSMSDLDWDCTEEVLEPPACISVTDSLATSQTIVSTDEPLYFIVNAQRGSSDLIKTEICFHGNFEGPGWSTGWKCLRDESPNDELFNLSQVDNNNSDFILNPSGLISFEAIKEALTATPNAHDGTLINQQGIMWGVNISDANGTCFGSGRYPADNDDGPGCSVDDSCMGSLSYEPLAPTCNEISMFSDSYATNKIENFSNLLPEQTVSFQCVGNDPSNQIRAHQYRIIIDGIEQLPLPAPIQASTDSGISTSINAEVNLTAGEYIVQCRVCTDTTEGSCQEWEATPLPPGCPPYATDLDCTNDAECISCYGSTARCVNDQCGIPTGDVNLFD